MLKFNSLSEQVCHIALPKAEGEQAIKDHSILFG